MDVIKEGCYSGLGWALNPVLVRERRGRVGCRDTEEPQGRPEDEEIGVSQPGAKDNYRELGSGEGVWPSGLANTVRLPASRTVRTNFCFVKPPSLWSFVMAALRSEHSPQSPNRLPLRDLSRDHHFPS